MRELVATKSFVYGTRRLNVGDYFTAASVGDARALVALQKAQQKPADGGELPAATPAPKKTPKPATKQPRQRKTPVRKPATKS